jgi:hypothetical protein
MPKRSKRTEAEDKHVDLVRRYKKIGISAVAAAVRRKSSPARSAETNPRPAGEGETAADTRAGLARGSQRSAGVRREDL